MIRPGARVLVPCAGLRDPLPLLDALLIRCAHVPDKFQLVMGWAQPPCVALPEGWRAFAQGWCSERGVGWVEQEVAAPEPAQAGGSPCTACRRARQAAVLRLAEREACSSLLFPASLEDFVESILAGLVCGGELVVPPPVADVGQVRLGWPLHTTEERLVRRYGRELGVPPGEFTCPHHDTARQEALRRALVGFDLAPSKLKQNILNSVARVKAGYLP
jgi:tRNA(Ile)-lysidine synthase TilS/MesJ